MENELRVEVATRKSLSEGPTTVQLRVEDAASGEVLSLVDFDASEWLNLTTGLSTKKVGFTSNHLERVGRKMKVRSENIPREDITTYDRDEAKQQALRWAKVGREQGEEVTVRLSNSGWVAIYRSWPEVD